MSALSATSSLASRRSLPISRVGDRREMINAIFQDRCRPAQDRRAIRIGTAAPIVSVGLIGRRQDRVEFGVGVLRKGFERLFRERVINW